MEEELLMTCGQRREESQKTALNPAPVSCSKTIRMQKLSAVHHDASWDPVLQRSQRVTQLKVQRWVGRMVPVVSCMTPVSLFLLSGCDAQRMPNGGSRNCDAPEHHPLSPLLSQSHKRMTLDTHQRRQVSAGGRGLPPLRRFTKRGNLDNDRS